MTANSGTDELPRVAVLGWIAVSSEYEPINAGGVTNEDASCLAAADAFDPVIEEYKKGIDITLIVENLKLTPHERAVKMQAALDNLEKFVGRVDLRRPIRQMAAQLKRVVEVLNGANVKFIVIGGWAAGSGLLSPLPGGSITWFATAHAGCRCGLCKRSKQHRESDKIASAVFAISPWSAARPTVQV